MDQVNRPQFIRAGKIKKKKKEERKRMAEGRIVAAAAVTCRGGKKRRRRRRRRERNRAGRAKRERKKLKVALPSVNNESAGNKKGGIRGRRGRLDEASLIKMNEKVRESERKRRIHMYMDT